MEGQDEDEEGSREEGGRLGVSIGVGWLLRLQGFRAEGQLIDGLPLNAWTTNAFKKIAGNWGETVFVDEDADENIANGRIPG
ncbi:hypothetical protein Tco_1147979 [Tanacetum coccineum]